jgi:hypothetical protein
MSTGGKRENADSLNGFPKGKGTSNGCFYHFIAERTSSWQSEPLTTVPQDAMRNLN